jgi:flavodoxin
MANLILYYSRKGENYVNGSIQNISKGNTERVAEFVQKAVGGDLFEIEPVREYSTSYMTCIKEAQAEQRGNERPAVKKLPENLDGYDTIFIGFPNWWGTMPMFMFTVLDAFDWVGKKIVPFCTNEGSGLGSSERDIKASCPGATVLSGLGIHGGSAASSEKQVAAWAKKSV